jgi:hypothetical protein
MLRPRGPNPHTVPATKKDDDDKLKPEGLSLDGPLVRYGLTDWKFSAPIGAVMAIPFIANEVRAVRSNSRPMLHTTTAEPTPSMPRR